MDMLIYTFLNVFLIVTGVCYALSATALIAAVTAFGGTVVYYFGVFIPAVNHARRRARATFKTYKNRRAQLATKGLGDATGQRAARPHAHDVVETLQAFGLLVLDWFVRAHAWVSLGERRKLAMVKARRDQVLPSPPPPRRPMSSCRPPSPRCLHLL